MLFIFSTPVLIRHLWQLKTVVFQHWCLICAVLLRANELDLSFQCRSVARTNVKHTKVSSNIDHLLSRLRGQHAQ